MTNTPGNFTFDLDPTKVLLTAAANGNIPKLQEALQEGGDVNGVHHEGGWTSLLFACQYNRKEVVEILLKHGGVDIEAKTEGDADTPLTIASYNGYADIVQLLLDNGAKANATDAYGRTALICAASQGHEEAVKVLLKHGADKDVKDVKGNPADQYATWEGHDGVAKLLS